MDFSSLGGGSYDLYEELGIPEPASFDGDGTSLWDPNSLSAVKATNLSQVTSTADPILQNMYENEGFFGGPNIASSNTEQKNDHYNNIDGDNFDWMQGVPGEIDMAETNSRLRGNSNDTADIIGHAYLLNAYEKAAFQAHAYAAYIAGRGDLNYKQKSDAVYVYPDLVWSAMKQSNIGWDLEGMNKVDDASLKALSDFGLLNPLNTSGVVGVYDPNDAGKEAVAMLPSSYTGSFDPINLDVSKSTVGMPNDVSMSYDDNQQILIGTVAISRSVAAAIGDAMVKQSWDATNGGGWAPGLGVSDFPKNEVAESEMNGFEATTDGGTFLSSAFQMQSVGQVEVFYSPDLGTYSYRVSENISNNGWSMRAVFQNSEIFQQIQLGIYRARY